MVSRESNKERYFKTEILSFLDNCVYLQRREMIIAVIIECSHRFVSVVAGVKSQD